MVVFTCNHCGESVHKPQVEKHYQFKCRNYKNLTCVYCFKDFKNDEYNVHTKCITEDERYAAKGTYKNAVVKKGEAKQESWMDMIKSICDEEKNMKESVRRLLETISGYSNVPRKKLKFMNFIKSSSGNRVNMHEVEEIWNIIEKYKAKNQSAKLNKTNQLQAQLDSKTTPTIDQVSNGEMQTKRKAIAENTFNSFCNEPSKKKVKTEGIPDVKVTIAHSQQYNQSKFDYTAKILEIVTKKQNIAVKKLQKKILKAYLSTRGQVDNEEKVVKKFNKKLKKLPNVNIENDIVILKQE